MANPAFVVPPIKDFKDWSQENLAKLASELWDENVRLRQDNRMLHEGWRQLLKDNLGKTPT